MTRSTIVTKHHKTQQNTAGGNGQSQGMNSTMEMFSHYLSMLKEQTMQR